MAKASDSVPASVAKAAKVYGKTRSDSPKFDESWLDGKWYTAEAGDDFPQGTAGKFIQLLTRMARGEKAEDGGFPNGREIRVARLNEQGNPISRRKGQSSDELTAMVAFQFGPEGSSPVAAPEPDAEPEPEVITAEPEPPAPRARRQSQRKR